MPSASRSRWPQPNNSIRSFPSTQGASCPCLEFKEVNGFAPPVSLRAWSHIPSILPAHLIQRMADLPKAVGFYRFDQAGEDVLTGAGSGLQRL